MSQNNWLITVLNQKPAVIKVQRPVPGKPAWLLYTTSGKQTWGCDAGEIQSIMACAASRPLQQGKPSVTLTTEPK